MSQFASPLRRPATQNRVELDSHLRGNDTFFELRHYRILYPAWSLHLENVVHMGIEMACQTSHWTQAVHVDAPILVETITHVKIHDLAEHQTVWSATYGEDLHHAALQVDRRFEHAWGLHLDARHRRKTSQSEFINVRRIIAGGEIHLLGQVVVHDVDDKIVRMLNIVDRILFVPLASPGRKRASRWIPAQPHEKAKRRQVGHARGTAARYPGNRPGYHAADE